MITIRDEVHDGVAELNDADRRETERWWEKVDPATLDMRSCVRCVLGQLFGDFDQGLELLGLASQAEHGLGFDLSYDQRQDGTYDNLSNEWLAVIAALRAGTYDPEVDEYPRYEAP